MKNRMLDRAIKILKNERTNESGFTLVELMVVVAIIGILAAVAIPQYQRFQSKARQSEARLALTGVYTAERAYAIEQNSFGSCMDQMGYAPDSGTRFYTVGFTDAAAAATSCGAGTVACNALQGATCTAGAATSRFMATRVEGTATLQADDAGLSATLTRATFTATARGNVQTTGATFDVWTMDHNKALTNTTPAL